MALTVLLKSTTVEMASNIMVFCHTSGTEQLSLFTFHGLNMVGQLQKIPFLSLQERQMKTKTT